MILDKKKFIQGICQRWIHSYEDDSQDVMVYRNEDYLFPLSRGRKGLEFKDDGTFIRYDIGKDDLPRKVLGRWEPRNKNKIQLFIKGMDKKSDVLDILFCDKNTLKIKRK